MSHGWKPFSFSSRTISYGPRPSLTSVIGRELVYSRRYDANRKPVERYGLYIYMVLKKNYLKKSSDLGFLDVPFSIHFLMFSYWVKIDRFSLTVRSGRILLVFSSHFASKMFT